MKTELLLLQDVAERLGVRYYRVVYAIKSGQVPDVRLRVGNRRVFQHDELCRLADFFGAKLSNKKESHAK
jgi:hypothetical protein